VQELFVEPDAQRQGIGRALLLRLGELLGPEPWVSLLVNCRGPAMAFYAKMGLSENLSYKLFGGLLPRPTHE
jgi:GNAT superfamily N-acetyltransferase